MKEHRDTEVRRFVVIYRQKDIRTKSIVLPYLCVLILI